MTQREDELVVKVDNMCRSIDEKPILKHINFEIRKGEMLSIIGVSGSGKSMLAKHIIGLEKPDSGRVITFGEDLSNLSYDEILEKIMPKIGYVFQGGALFGASDIWGNIASALTDGPIPADMGGRMMYPEKDRAYVDIRVKIAMTLAGISSDDCDRLVHQKPAQLSGGERKRVAIARSLITEAPLMIYDEPAAGLDPYLVVEISEHISQLHKMGKGKKTTVAIVHNQEALRIIDSRVIMLHDHGIYYDGPYKEFMASRDPTILRYRGKLK